MDCPIFPIPNVLSFWAVNMWLGLPLRMNPIGLPIKSKMEEDPGGGVGGTQRREMPPRCWFLLHDWLMHKPCIKTVSISLEVEQEWPWTKRP